MTFAAFESRVASLAYRDGYSRLVQENALLAETAGVLCWLLFAAMERR